MQAKPGGSLCDPREVKANQQTKMQAGGQASANPLPGKCLHLSCSALRTHDMVRTVYGSAWPQHSFQSFSKRISEGGNLGG